MDSRVLVCGIVAHEEIAGPWRSAEPLFGGAGLYSALAATQFAPARLTTVVGLDLSAKLGEVARDCLDITQVAVIGAESVRLRARYRPGSDALETLSVVWGPLGAPRPRPHIDERPRVLVLGNEDPGYQRDLLRAAGAEIVVYGTFGAWLQHRPAECRALHEEAHVVVVSEHEERSLQALRSKPRRDPILVLTRGDRGLDVIHNGTTTHLPAPDVPKDEVRDVTGAGDVLLGAMAGWLSARRGSLDAAAVVDAARAAAPVVAAKLASCGAEGFSRSLRRSSPERRTDDRG